MELDVRYLNVSIYMHTQNLTYGMVTLSKCVLCFVGKKYKFFDTKVTFKLNRFQFSCEQRELSPSHEIPKRNNWISLTKICRTNIFHQNIYALLKI